MLPPSGASSYSTNVSARRRIFFQTHFLTDAQLQEWDPVKLLELCNQSKSDLAYTILENLWITSYMKEHHNAVAKATFRQVHFKNRQYVSDETVEHNTSGQDNSFSSSVRARLHFSSDPTYSSFYSFARNFGDSLFFPNFTISVSFKISLCEEEIVKITAELKQINRDSHTRFRETISKIQNIELENRETVRSLKLLREYIGEGKENDKQGHRRDQKNRMRKFINTFLAKGETQLQRMDLQIINMQRKNRELLKLIETRKTTRNQMELAELSKNQCDIRQQKERLKQLNGRIFTLRKQIVNVDLAKSKLSCSIVGLTKRSNKTDVDIVKMQENISAYDANYEKHQNEVIEWKTRLESIQMRVKSVDLPSIDDYMQFKRQLTSLDHEVATLQRITKAAKIGLDRAQRKLKQQRTSYTNRIANKDNELITVL